MRHERLTADFADAASALPLEVAVVVPTLNEVGNVEALIANLSLVLAGRGWEVVFVDDNSSDGTSGLIRSIGRDLRHVRVVERVGRRGLSSAVIEGILATAAPTVVVMDGDLQHDAGILPQLIDAVTLDGADIAIGTRYNQGGTVGDWDAGRARMSRLATRLGQVALGTNVSDPMSGFFAVDRTAFERSLPKLSGIGFKILLDLLASSPTTLRVAEVPYSFGKRVAGESKLGARVLAEYAELIAEKSIGRFVPVRMFKFLFVGGLGVFVHLGVLTTALHAGYSFLAAQTAAVMIAIASNFFLNNSFTYADRKLRGWKVIPGLASFYAISAAGAVANIGIGNWMAGQDERWWVAGMAGVIVGAVWNFAMSGSVTWRK
ncbi:glycosyltransferase family 2 protein [Sphingomonas piscis]|uniref:Glycosyltransferase family 2 protein n=1 Tax=Sphingomonas piscis TaxID=2714943 RepID=A0A6G7YRD2_9SPHN|nr:glycosyltransferase family 2 protein [Sphingomonas piscis]QIK79292.1 glycosyltransferase family 2 protein [Sphingomonas piscis]